MSRWFRGVPQYSLLAGILLLALVSCSTTRLEQALQGKFEFTENNRIINDYCQGCHVHKGFLPDQHVSSAVRLYDRPPYTQARECRVCHYLEGDPAEKNEHRGTRWPQWVAAGKFRSFEAQELRSQGSSAH
ncbi:MAG: hypothetical protein HYY65_07650 [Candidatus Tectomicrobia bacterium]|uniref:Uncharacterized protein n=1 Tax=Tectimicrobiota bacterium TaxID=2528274 RepID=A0A932GQ43_UNCTE|nr:hypothetical protein [Candidatus Tectomicrobia bacterium]